MNCRCAREEICRIDRAPRHPRTPLDGPRALRSPGAPAHRRAGALARRPDIRSGQGRRLEAFALGPAGAPADRGGQGMGGGYRQGLERHDQDPRSFPSEQLGKAFDHYDMARDGIADITYVNPATSPAVSRSSPIGQMPFTFGDARKGTAALDSWYRKYAHDGNEGYAFLPRLHSRSGRADARRRSSRRRTCAG